MGLPTDIAGRAAKAAKGFLSTSLRSRLVPPLRAYMRYMPTSLGKDQLWRSVIKPHLSWLPVEFEATARFGARLRGNTEDFIQRHVYYFGIWEPDLTDFLASRLRPGDGFIDVGANVGYFTLQASRLVGPSGAVVAIEASPSIFRMLEANLALNDVTNVRVVNVAVSDRPGLVRLFRGPADNIGGSTLLDDGTQGATFESEVKALPLGDILVGDEWRRARVVKIDVEGSEALVATGMASLLGEARQDLEVVMEIAPRMLEKRGKQPDEIIGLFRSAGFHVYRLENEYSDDTYLRPAGERHRPVRVTGPISEQTDVVFSRLDRPSL